MSVDGVLAGILRGSEDAGRMRRAEVDTEPALATALFLFAVAAIGEVVAISQSGSICRDGAGWVLVVVFSVPVLWLGGVFCLYRASRDRRLRDGWRTATGTVAAIVVAIVFLPALASQIDGCFS